MEISISTRKKVCSSCYTVQSRLEYVDFDSDWEGPLIARETSLGAALDPLPVDDLILCEDCVRTAAKLFGMSSSEDASRVVELEAEVIELRLARVESERRLAAIEKAFEGRPKKTKPQAAAA